MFFMQIWVRNTGRALYFGRWYQEEILVEKIERDFMNTGNECLKMEREKDIVIITLNRPEAVVRASGKGRDELQAAVDY